MNSENAAGDFCRPGVAHLKKSVLQEQIIASTAKDAAEQQSLLD